MYLISCDTHERDKCSSLAPFLSLCLFLPLHEPVRKRSVRSQAAAPVQCPHSAHAEPVWGNILPTTLKGGASRLAAPVASPPHPRLFIILKNPNGAMRLHLLFTVSAAHRLQAWVPAPAIYSSHERLRPLFTVLVRLRLQAWGLRPLFAVSPVPALVIACARCRHHEDVDIDCCILMVEMIMLALRMTIPHILCKEGACP
jgi:hypothetical protein